MKEFIKWITGITMSIVGVNFTFTEACNMITSASNIQVITGFLLLGLTLSGVLYGGYWLFTTLEEKSKKYFCQNEEK